MELIQALADEQRQEQQVRGSSGLGSDGHAVQFGETQCLVRF